MANHQDGLRALGHDVQLVAGWQRLVFGRGQVIRRGLSKWWRLVGAKPISSKGYFEMATASSINRLSEPFVERCFFRFAEDTTWCFWALKFLSQRHFLQRRGYPLGRGLPSTRFEGCLIRSRTKCFRGIWWVHWCICSCLWLVAKWLKISHTKGYDSEHLQDDALWIFFASKKVNLCCAAPWHPQLSLSWIAHDDALRGSDHWNNWIPCGHWRWANLSKQLGHAMVGHTHMNGPTWEAPSW